jgi:hypothetical protein
LLFAKDQIKLAPCSAGVHANAGFNSQPVDALLQLKAILRPELVLFDPANPIALDVYDLLVDLRLKRVPAGTFSGYAPVPFERRHEAPDQENQANDCGAADKKEANPHYRRPSWIFNPE